MVGKRPSKSSNHLAAKRARMTKAANAMVIPKAKPKTATTKVVPFGRSVHEKHYIDQDSAINISKVWTDCFASGGHFFPSIQGDGIAERSGLDISCSWLSVKGFVEMVGREVPASGTDWPKYKNELRYDEIRVLLFIDKYHNGAAATPLDLVNVPSSTDRTTLGFTNKDTQHRYKILKDETFRLEGEFPSIQYEGTTYFYNAVKKYFNWNIPLKFKARFNGSSGGLTNIVENSVHMIAICSGPSSTSGTDGQQAAYANNQIHWSSRAHFIP
jgi:hypothetical protein